MKTQVRHAFVVLIIWSLFLQYSILHNYLDQVNLYRYSNIFASFIKMFQMGYIIINPSNLFTLNAIFSPRGTVSLEASSIIRTASFFPNLVMFHITLQHITNIEPYKLVIFPIGIITGPLSYITLAKELIKIGKNEKLNSITTSTVLFVLSIYGMIYMAGSTKIYQGAYAAGVVLPIQILTTAILISLLYTQFSNWKFYVIYVVFVFSLTLYWHSAVLGALAMVISIMLVVLFFYRYKYEIIRTTILSVTVVISFTRLWQNTAYIKTIFGAKDTLVSDFTTMILLKLKRGAVSNVPYVYSYRSNVFGKMYFVLTLILYLNIALLYLLGIRGLLKLCSQTKRCEKHVFFIALISTSPIIAQGIIAILYFKSYSINFPYLAMYLPIFSSLMFITNHKFVKWNPNIFHFKIMLALLILIASVLAVLSPIINEGGETSKLKYEDTLSFYWVYSHTNWEIPHYCDFNVIGKYLYREASIQKPIINFRDLDPYQYADIIQNKSPKLGIYIFDKKSMVNNMPINVNYRRSLLLPHYDKVSLNSHLSKIYDDNRISIHSVSI